MVYVNLQLSVMEKFVVHETMVKILAISKNPCAKIYYLIQKPEPVIERMYLPQCFGNKFFLWKLHKIKEALKTCFLLHVTKSLKPSYL